MRLHKGCQARSSWAFLVTKQDVGGYTAPAGEKELTLLPTKLPVNTGSSRQAYSKQQTASMCLALPDSPPPPGRVF